jgi:LPXTG-site transpeptidase (sortase) family protein
MKKDTSLMIVIFCATLVSAGVFMTTIVHSFFYAPDEEVSVSLSKTQDRVLRDSHLDQAQEENSTKPIRLIIPPLRINARVQDVGVGKSGNMAVPSNFTDVGWYRYGPIPGEKGSAVIAGHMDNALAFDGVFHRLGEMKVGDRISVVLSDNIKVDFAVYAVDSYSYDAVPVDLLFNRNDGTYLNLVTCGGTWIQEEKSYDRRVVVFAEKLE